VSSELDRIARLAALFGGAQTEGVELGIGDDCAILAMGGERLVWTIDAQVEGVHFRTDLVSWEDEGWRSFMAAASDLAAMGARPWCALSSIAAPRSLDDEAFDALSRGQAAAACAVGAPIVGGNLSRADAASITTTLLGRAAEPLPRAAKSGDGVWIAGPVGLAAAGLAALERRLGTDASVEAAVEAWRRPVARIHEGLAIVGKATGAIDVSDGLARDLGHVARASGLRAVIERDGLDAHLAASPALGAVARSLGVRPFDLALHGGEDYALVAASRVDLASAGFTRIGRFEPGEGLAFEDADGLRAIDPRGFDHFA
jgi:thiamine-monophosphate kinase